MGQIIGAARDVGARSRQEDNYDIHGAVDQTGALKHLLMIVADGMGGHAGGHIASRAVVEAFAASFEPDRDIDPSGVPARLHAAMEAANRSIATAAEADPALRDMGSTVVGALVWADDLWWVSVGDSSLYLLRGDSLQRLNADHSMKAVFAELAAEGRLVEGAAASGGHVLRSALTGGHVPLVNLVERPWRLLPGDRLLMATDGLDTLPEDKLLRILSGFAPDDAQAAVEALIAGVKAQEKDNQDNVSVILYSHVTD